MSAISDRTLKCCIIGAQNYLTGINIVINKLQLITPQNDYVDKLHDLCYEAQEILSQVQEKN